MKPPPLVLVRWVDIAVPGGGHWDSDTGTADVITCGFLVEKNRKYSVFAQSICLEGDPGGFISIPNSVIKKITVLKRIKNVL
jgi:hypothetical protein